MVDPMNDPSMSAASTSATSATTNSAVRFATAFDKKDRACARSRAKTRVL